MAWLKATYDTQKMKVKSWLLPNEDFVKEMSFTWFVFHQRKYFYERFAASSSTLRIVHFLRHPVHRVQGSVPFASLYLDMASLLFNIPVSRGFMGWAVPHRSTVIIDLTSSTFSTFSFFGGMDVI